MRAIPNMTVLAPCDGLEIKQALFEALRIDGPVYIRMTAGDVETVTSDLVPFEIGKARFLRNGGKDVAIFSTGIMAPACLAAADILASRHNLSVAVISMATVKPIDKQAILDSASESGLVVTVEEHNIIGGLGSAVCEIIAETGIGKVVRMGVHDRFCGIGSACHLLEAEGLSPEHICRQVLAALN